MSSWLQKLKENIHWSWMKDKFMNLNKREKVAIVSAIGITSAFTMFHFLRKRNSHCKSEYVRNTEARMKSIEVGDGAKMYWNEYGDVDNGYPILVFHGGLTCNLEGLLSEKIAKKYNLRLIIVDRPECGQSTLPSICDNKISNLPLYYPLSSYMSDIKQLLSHLNINDNEYGVAGSSHSGLHALSSCFYLKPKFINIFVGCPLAKKKYMMDNKEIIGQGYISGITGSNNLFPVRFQQGIIRFLVLYCKSLMIAMCRFQGKQQHPKNLYSDDIDDETGLSRLELLHYIMFRSCDRGIKGTLYTSQLLNENWGFDLDKDVDKEIKDKLKICMYYGKKDQIIPSAFVQHYYQNYLLDECKFKNIEFNMYDDCGHWLNTDIWDNAYKRTREYIDNNQ